MTDPKRAQPLDRRGFFRGAASLSIGSFGATALLSQLQPSVARGSEVEIEGGTTQLDAQTQRVLRWAGKDPADWVRPHPGADHNVVIVGGGQSGLAIAYGLRRKGVGRVDVIEQATPGEAGIWRKVARMRQLRTPKTLIGPELGNSSLGVRAWYETLHGPAAFDRLDRISRVDWADYLVWFEQITGTKVRYRTRLVDIEPAGDLLRLHLETDGARRTETTRKLVLANGYAGAGGPNVPEIVGKLPTKLWTHTATPPRFEALAGKVVGVLGAGSSAFDAAATALEHGASEVHLYSRRSFIDYQGGPQPTSASPPPDRGIANLNELFYELPDEVRWRGHLQRRRRVASVPLDSIERAVAFKNFHLHLNSGWTETSVAGGKVVAMVGGKKHRFDHVIAATGYAVDLSAQPELARIHDSILLWADRYQPPAGEQDAAGGKAPYLGAGFEFQPRPGTDANYARNIHCFNLAAQLSYGMPVGDIPSSVAHPRLIAAIARDLFVDGVDVAAHKRFSEAPQTAPDPTPYQKSVSQA
ncbi:NAD(P)-binding domain-containing protein [Steroidobacter cummioxidans]|uniref:NAD(P)-binding domain-containing protein n=1 Tax=Steroidobacter cummioxidans TaxID=1803913 RepID=UPI000E3133E4|nr:NAD(P)/FAD-dependent oxidoreductase [Steroidobacter cummioxidans]